MLRGSACESGCLLMSFVASPQAHSTSIEADATTKPFFDHEPIEGFFNTNQLGARFGTRAL